MALMIFFVSICPELAKDIHSDINPLTYVNNVNNSIVIFDVSCDEIKNIIRSLKNSNAGHDEFPTFVRKLCVDSYIEPLTFLINYSLKTGVFPSELKLARVVPIFKAGDSSALTNYRPISVLTFFAKVFEKIVYNKLLNFISDNNILYDHQYGFRKGRSTQQAIIDTDTDTDNSLFRQFNDKSNNQCSTFRINTNSFNVERHGDHIKTYIHVDIT